MITGDESLQKVKRLQSKLDQSLLPPDIRQNTANLEPIFIGTDGEPRRLSEVKPSHNIAISTSEGNEPLPIDIHGKTLKELKALGFKEVATVQMKKKGFGPGYQPVLDAGTQHELR